MKRIHHHLGRYAYVLFRILSRLLPFSKNPRTRVLVILNDSEILLVKNWMSKQQWALPGGGVKRGEDPARAAARELREETGIQVDPRALQFIGHMPNPGFPPVVMVYKLHLGDSDSAAAIPPHARFEIIDLAWHRLTDLPADRVVLVDHVLSQSDQQG